jgi:transposase-like protein
VTAANLRGRLPTPSNHWHFDEIVIVIRGHRYWLWHAVDNEGEVLNFLVQSLRDTKAAVKLMRKLLKRQGVAPSRIVTEKLRSYRATFRQLALTAKHDQGFRANNRAENPDQPVPRRERKMQRFKSSGGTQCFLSIHAATCNTFYHQHHLLNRSTFKQMRA